MSARFGFSKQDFKSAIRHTVIPLIAGAAVTAFDAYSLGGLTLAMAGKGAAIAVGSGLLRALVRWASVTTSEG